jgi:hypothetical protein
MNTTIPSINVNSFIQLIINLGSCSHLLYLGLKESSLPSFTFIRSVQKRQPGHTVANVYLADDTPTTRTSWDVQNGALGAPVPPEKTEVFPRNAPLDVDRAVLATNTPQQLCRKRLCSRGVKGVPPWDPSHVGTPFVL